MASDFLNEMRCYYEVLSLAKDKVKRLIRKVSGNTKTNAGARLTAGILDAGR